MTGIFKKLVPLAAVLATAALADPVQITFTGVNGAAAFGYYVGPYYAQLEGKNVSIYCDDFANEVNWNQTWQANLTKIVAGSDLSNTRFGGTPNALKNYQEIAWLDAQFAVQPSSQYGDIHATIWDIFDPTGAPTPSSNSWLNLAEQSYQSMTYDNFRVITNVGPVLPTGQVQEFLTIVAPGVNTATSTPEPSALLLMAAGLLALSTLLGIVKRRTRKPVTIPIE